MRFKGYISAAATMVDDTLCEVHEINKAMKD